MKLTLSTIAKSYGHGLALRVFALFAKLVFLFFVVPGLNEGVYSRYLYLFTLALIFARIMSLGAEEHLPTIIRRETSKIAVYFPFFGASFIGAMVTISAYWLIGHEWILTIGLVLQLASGWMLGGLSRSIDPGLYERLLNIPVLLFVGYCLIQPPNSIGHLITIYCVTTLVVQTWIAWNILPGQLPRPSQFYAAIPTLYKTLLPGLFKTSSNILVVLNTRAAVVVPAMLLALTVSDQIALAISIGEAFFQLGMVIVMRHYAAFCRHEKDEGFMIKACWALFGATTVLGIIFLLVPMPIQIDKIDWQLVGWAIIFSAALLVFMEARYFYWSKDEKAWSVNLFQLAFFVGQILIVFLVSEDWWFIAMSIQAAFVATVFLVYASIRRIIQNPNV